MHSSLAQQRMDYEIDFVDCQRLERALEKLSLSREILMAIKHIACTLQSLSDYDKSISNYDLRIIAGNSQEIFMHISNIRGYRRTASALQSRAIRTSILVSSPGWNKKTLVEVIALVNETSGLPKNGLT